MAVTLPASGYMENSSRTKGEMKTSLEQLRDAISTIDSEVDQNISDISTLQADVAVLSGLSSATETSEGIVELATTLEVQAGTDTTRCVTPAGLDSRTATETRTGIAEIATTLEVQTGTDNERIVTPSGLRSCVATEIRPGVAELATNVEVQTGTDTGRIVTPAGLRACSATETRPGVAELATQSEVDAGTDTERIVTPATLSSKISDTIKYGSLINLASYVNTGWTDNGSFAIPLYNSSDTILAIDFYLNFYAAAGPNNGVSIIYSLNDGSVLRSFGGLMNYNHYFNIVDVDSGDDHLLYINSSTPTQIVMNFASTVVAYDIRCYIRAFAKYNL